METKFNIGSIHFYFSTRKAKTRAFAAIRTRLWITMPTWMTRCGNHGRRPNRCGTTQATPIRSRRAVQWWASMVARLSSIIWPDRGHHCPASRRSS